MEHGPNYAYLKVAAGKEASPGVDLFDFFELFGDNDGEERDEQLLTGDDQAMFAQFLDAFDGGNSGAAGGGAAGGLGGMGGITPSLDLFGNCVGASDLLGMANASFAKYSNGGSNANSVPNNTMPTGSTAHHSGNGLMAEDSLTIPVSIPMHHVETPSALFPLHQAQHHHPINHHTNHPMALHVLNSNGNTKNSTSNGDGVDEYLSQSLPKRMKSSSNTNATANAAASFGFIPFFQQQQQHQQQQQQQQHQLHQMQQQQMHHQQNQQQQQQPQQQPQQQHMHSQIHHHPSSDFMSFAPKLDPYTNNMMPPIASYQPQLGSSTRLPTPSPPLATQVLHSTSSLVTSTSTSALSSAISAANHNQGHQAPMSTAPVSLPKKRGRKPKEVPTSDDTKSAASIGGGANASTTASSSGSTPALFPSTKSSKPLLTPSEKKANHIQAEQRRRAQIRDALKELSQIVPGLLPPIDGELTVEGSSRVEILEGTKRYVETLRENNDRLRRQLLEA
ncbi:hypothetical protein HDU81_006179 [Chytriomyces hyalinus]|nr:hypothetical protein HDU81_006179 [Chytriomyces hyalinus]